MRLRHLLPALLLPVLVHSATPEEMSPTQRQAHLASFEQVWNAIAKKHWDPKLGGLDWQKIHDEFKPQVERAPTHEAVRTLLSDMLGRLKQTHFAIVPGEVYDALGAERKGSGTPGLTLRLLEGKVLVTDLEPGSPAEKAGVKRGWELLQVDGKPVAPRIQKVKDAYAQVTHFEILATRSVEAMLGGPTGTSVEVLMAADGPLKTLRLERQAPRGKPVTFGNMPTQHFWIERQSLPGQVRYLRFNMWLDAEAVASAFATAMENHGDCKGFVIDLRGNPGGIGGMAMGAAGWFTDRQDLKLGTMFLKDTQLKWVIFPRATPFKGPLAILVDGCTGSTSEVFAGGMQDIGRARIFGTRSAGAALPSVFERLPNGDGFQYAIANYISEGGKPLEGLGVTPDETIAPTQRELLAGKDPVLDRALSWIRRTNP